MTQSPFLAIHDNVERRRFEAELADGSFAFAAYELEPGRIVFVHTIVPAQFEGQGVGSALIRFGLNWAREHGLKVVPICSFFAAYIRKHPQEQDLLEPEWAEKLGLG